MKHCLRSLACAVLGGAVLQGAPNEATKKPAESVAAESLVADLGDPRYPVRERATRELWAMGDEVEALLEEAAESDRAELALRARDLLRKIRIGILPDSPPEVVELVDRYDRASPSRRVDIIRELKALGAWAQVLRIHELEDDPETLRAVAGEMKGVSRAAAREHLAGDHPDPEKAREMLEIGRPEPDQLMALADFHRTQGSLDVELERARKLEGYAGHLWRFALLAAAERPVEAAEEAEEAGEFEAAARLRLVAGDPTDYLRLAPVPNTQIPPVALDGYRDAVLAIRDTGHPPEGLVDQLAASVRHELDDESWRSLMLLYALGETEVADPLFAKLSPAAAFRYFEQSERIDAALRTVDIDPDAPDYAGWARRKFEEVAANPGDADESVDQLHYVGHFLEQRGLHEPLREGYVEPLEALARENTEWFVQVISELTDRHNYYISTTPVIGPVLEAAADYAAGDPVRIDEIRTVLFEDFFIDHGTWESQEFWDSLAGFAPDLTLAEQFRWMCYLTGRLPDPEGRTERWWQWMRAEVEGADERASAVGYRVMLESALMNSDAERFLETLDASRDAGLEPREITGMFSFERFQVLSQAGVGRYDELVPHFRSEAERLPRHPLVQARLGAVLRAAGRTSEAEKADRRAARLALGDARAMNAMRSAYASFGHFDKAAEWGKRAIMQSVEGGGSFRKSLEYLSNDAGFRGDWALMSSFAEAELLEGVMTGDRVEHPLPIIRKRNAARIGFALSTLDERRGRSMELLERCYRSGGVDGSLADFFFPALREEGLTGLHDRWFEDTWSILTEVLDRFPESHNTMNTAAWTASRANRRLDAAEGLVTRALELVPHQGAYLDTLAEVWFARGDRERALRWSRRARAHMPSDLNLLRQHERFAEDAFPVD